MLSFLAKAAFSGLIVALVTVIARRSPGWGGLVAALPITSILALSLLWIDTRDPARIQGLSYSIVAFILPSLPFFFILPSLVRSGLSFWVAMAVSVLATLVLYAGSFWALGRLGVRI